MNRAEEKQLVNDLWDLWDKLAEHGELHIGKNFSETYDKMQKQVKNFELTGVVQPEETYTYKDIEAAVKYGINYGADEGDEELTVPQGNIQQWLQATKLRTAEEWQRLNPDVIVIDPDGWDRKNHKKDWYEDLITYQEYVQRRQQSTCMFKKEKDEKE